MSLTVPILDIINQSTSELLGKHEYWERVELGFIANVLNGFAFSSPNFNKEKGMPLIRIRDITRDTTETKYDGYYDEIYLVKPGDLLVGMDGDFNCALWHGPISLLNQRVCKIEVYQDFFDKKFLFYVLPGYLKAINDFTSSMTVKHLSSKSIEGIPLPLPPRPEQTRIVAAIEQKFRNLDAGIASLQSAKAKIPQYRASLLKAAVEGELTAEWREEHPVEESGEQLLVRVLDERRAHWEEQQLAEMREKGEVPWNDEWKKKYREPEEPDVDKLPELPEGWCWATVEQAGSVQLGRQRAPQYHKGPYMRPYLRVANVFEDRIDTSDVLSMNFTPEEFEIYSLRYGDILLNEGQSLELLGRPAMYRDEIPGACFQNTLIRFRCHQGLLPEYALIVFRSYMYTQKFQRIGKHTTNIAHLGAGRFAVLEFPLSPVAEQEQIIAEVEAQLSEIAKMEEAIGHSLKRAEHERQSILREAFAGRLVEQDTADEPASVLLERIREERRRREEVENGRSKGERRMQMRKRKVSRTDRERIYYTLQGAERALKPEELFTQAGFKVDEQPESVEAFQVELTPLEHAGAIREERPDYNTVVLRAVELPEEKMLELFGTMEDGQEDETEEGSAVEVGEDERGKDVEQARLWDL